LWDVRFDTSFLTLGCSDVKWEFKNMKKWIAFVMLVLALSPAFVTADDFLGAPVLPGGNIVVSREDRLEKTYDMPYDEVVKFYKEALKDFKYVKVWDRGNSMYMEDHLNRPWHSITILKGDNGVTTVVTIKDNWTWIIGTLVIRFVGVFVVLFVLYVALSFSGAIISRLVDKPKKKKAAA
jgi:hypothetical protein